jgi:hypothetical protein
LINQYLKVILTFPPTPPASSSHSSSTRYRLRFWSAYKVNICRDSQIMFLSVAQNEGKSKSKKKLTK